jgi:hypothetical protein
MELPQFLADERLHMLAVWLAVFMIVNLLINAGRRRERHTAIRRRLGLGLGDE